MNFVLWFSQNLKTGSVSEYTRLLWIALVEKNVKGGQASIILSCQDDDFYYKLPSVYFVNLQIEASIEAFCDLTLDIAAHISEISQRGEWPFPFLSLELNAQHG